MATHPALADATRKAAELAASLSLRRRIDDGYLRMDVFPICTQLHVPVVLRPLDGLLGAFLRDPSPGIILNAKRPTSLMRLTCAHELGHFCLSHPTTYDLYDPDAPQHASLAREREADQFAYELLVPRWLVVHVCNSKRWDRAQLGRPEIVYQLSLRLGISYQAMAWTLVRLRFLSRDAASRLLEVAPRALKRAALGDTQPEDPRADVWVLDANDQKSILEPNRGDSFVIRLNNHAASGFLWSLEDASKEGFELEPITESKSLSDTLNEKKQIRVGSMTTQSEYLLRVRGAGEEDDRRDRAVLRESRPWVGVDSEHDPTYKVDMMLSTPRMGLSPADKRAILTAGE